jgi:YARHG domain
MTMGHSSEYTRRQSMAKTLVMSAGLSLLLVFAPSRAQANCYELIGCTNSDYFKVAQLKQLSCQILWEVRNTIYKERGYCFHTQRGIKFFGNAGCQYDDVALAPLNDAERYNVSAIKKVEARKGCS